MSGEAGNRLSRHPDWWLRPEVFPGPRRLAIISAATPPQVNGPAITLQGVIPGLLKRDWNVSVHVPDYADLEDHPNLRVVRYRALDLKIYPSIRYPLRPVPMSRHAPGGPPPELIHVLTPGIFELLLLKRMWRPGTRVLVSILSDFADMAQSLSPAPLLRRAAGRICESLQDVLLSHADGVHVLNRSRAAALEHLGERVFLVPPGLDAGCIRSARAHPHAVRAGLAPGERAVAYVGRLSREKGIERLLDLVAWDPANVLFVIGDGPKAAQLKERAAAMGVDGRIRFLGVLRQAELFRYLAGMDLLVLPSRSEEFGQAALEALALGVPVLSCADLRGPDELARRWPLHTVLVRFWRREEVTAAVRRLAGRRVPPVDLDYWDWSAVAGRLEGCYRTLLEGTQSEPALRAR